MYGIMTKISLVSSQNQLLMLKNAPEFTKIMIGEIVAFSRTSRTPPNFVSQAPEGENFWTANWPPL